jgi:hypothetical protein
MLYRIKAFSGKGLIHGSRTMHHLNSNGPSICGKYPAGGWVQANRIDVTCPACLQKINKDKGAK